ncbi:MULTISPECIES: LysE/ArgO family amino acid transporter [Streptomyces]|uniref:LysE-type translocator n=1 Tax=Streptomyces griseus subsp. griseus (strain JCM 4626 / CBS 651.72 / NBRC 13350 / KCC S-0626 / ISP 5235) TaxID=455632 RepID=B1VN92_STRGG|nr:MULTISPECIES: LysE/ArgO family amino acid transporter [Streptomyces]MYR09485.1 LysE family transporter [Streptomyces sp. SID724]MYT82088.1 LysE family transporter [Streptomyces sp. SID8364]MBW3709491.1 amino acid transporter [Streptomyces griseus]NEB51802.1 amino acid transporter [Streptomyces griseus]SBV07588.1 L-lysine exporter family protein LysE/ArgO [Streptomyces sp. MnatMP-M77]
MTNALTTAAAGFGTGLSLIVAIGAQNALVLRQGVRRDGVLAVVGICALSDAVLIALGVAGVGALVVAWPSALTVVGLLGAVFLIGYGLLAARRVLRPSALRAADAPAASRRGVVLTCLAMTWLNPHVYLDTVFLLGSVAADRGPLRWTFGLGAILASVCWFAALGFGARLLSGVLARPSAWRVLDGLVAVTMIGLGVRLALSA